MPSDTLSHQLAFLREIDQVKGAIRTSPLLDRCRTGNSAEHSWHLAMYVLILQEHAAPTVDTARVVRMLLIHDIVEVDVGDMPIHQASSGTSNAAGRCDQGEAERAILGLIARASATPSNQAPDQGGI